MLDMNKLEEANAAMEETGLWLLDSVYRTVAKVAFDLWDYRFPRNFDTIMLGLMSSFMDRYDKWDPVYTKFVDTYLIKMSGKDLVKTISDTLRGIPEYLEWKTPHGDDGFFIDLDAFDQNVYFELRSEVIISTYFEDEPIFSTDFEKEIENDD